MKKVLWIVLLSMLLFGCDEAKESADQTTREITGGNMVKQGKAMKKQLEDINALQEKRMEKME
ncbi:MAG: hypothetical protein Q9M22_01320 [Mariprofundaceae bacterium]|nr:hypothetical protein [Mariprofundaceae bacterium]